MPVFVLMDSGLSLQPIVDRFEGLVALIAFIGVALLVPLYMSQRRDILRLRALRDAEPMHPGADLAASEALLDRAEADLEEVYAAQGNPVTRESVAVAATAIHPEGLLGDGDTQATSERPALTQLTIDRVALEPHPRFKRLRRQAMQPRWLAAIGLAAALLALAGIVGSEHLLSGDDNSGSMSHSPVGVNPGNVSVAVLNGTASSGLASKVASDIKPNGFKLMGLGNIEGKFPDTIVYFRATPGGRQEARAVADVLGRKTPIQPITTDAEKLSGGADVIVIAGEDRARL